MPIWVLLVVALLGVSGSGWADVVPQRKWLQVRSPRFTVMGEAGARDLRLVAERMEQLHAALGQMTRSTQVETSDVMIVVFKTEAAFRPYQPRYQGKPVAVAGYFLPGPMNYIAILADRDYDYSDVVYHEYVHLVAERAVGSMPSASAGADCGLQGQHGRGRRDRRSPEASGVPQPFRGGSLRQPRTAARGCR